MQDRFDTFRQGAAFQKNSVAAAPALDSDIRTQADHLPFPAPARVRLSQLHDISQGKIGKHAVIIITPG
jgi:hypothetical protein